VVHQGKNDILGFLLNRLNDILESAPVTGVRLCLGGKLALLHGVYGWSARFLHF